MSLIQQYDEHPITEQQFTVMRNWLRGHLRAAVGDRPLVISLSGGVDSATLLFAALDAKLDVRAVTFQMEHFVSPDMRAARALCRTFGVPHLEVNIPASRLDVLRDVERLIDMLHWEKTDRIRKTAIQCAYPYLYVVPRVQKWLGDEHPIIVTGFAAGSATMTTRADGKMISMYGEASVSSARYSRVEDPNVSTYHIMQLGRDLGAYMFDLFDDPLFFTWVQQFPISLTNQPVQKYMLVGLYKPYWKIGPFYRTPESFQVVSGIREAHDQLLTLQKYRRHHAIIGAYHQIAIERGVMPRVGTQLPARHIDTTLLLDDGTLYGCPNDDSRALLANLLAMTRAEEIHATTYQAT